jgi:dTDP-4-amino-4,6-dideoxygalactose transaminase
MHAQGALSHLGYRTGDFPVSEEACRSVLTIPMYPSLDLEAVDTVCGHLREIAGARVRSAG